MSGDAYTPSGPNWDSPEGRELRLALILLEELVRSDKNASARALGFLAGVRDRLGVAPAVWATSTTSEASGEGNGSDVGATDIAYFWLRGAQTLGMLREDGDWDRLISVLDGARTVRPEA